jgi:hypothetical protein
MQCLSDPDKKSGPSQRGQVLSLYIKKGVLVIIIPNKHYETVTEIFHLCNKNGIALFPSHYFAV